MNNIRELIIQRVFLKPLGPLRGLFVARPIGFVFSSSSVFLPFYMKKPFSLAAGKKKKKNKIQGSLSGHCLLHL